MTQSMKRYVDLLKPIITVKNYASDSQTAVGQKVHEHVKPFKDIPGPKSLPIIGTVYQYLPFIGNYDLDKLHLNGMKKFKEYGPIVREEVTPGVHIVWLFRPEDFAELFRLELRERGLHPERRSHLALNKYRLERPHIYNTGGLLPTNGPEWWRIRRELQKGLSRQQSVRSYLNESDSVVREFIQSSVPERHENFIDLLARLYLELTGLIAFDVKLNGLSAEEMHDDSVSSKLIKAAYDTNGAILKLDNGLRLWRYFETPLYKKMCAAQKFMEEIALDLVSQKIESLKISPPSGNPSLLEIYLANPSLDEKDVVGMACDMLLAGVDTITNSTSYALYHLGNNPEIQQRLHEEAKRLLPRGNEVVSDAVLQKATYTKAVIKETFRMNPIAVGIGRILQSDIVFSGYEIPKGTVVVTQNQVICRSSDYFEDPDQFKPERWIRSDEGGPGTAYNPFLVLPFGHGPRSCIARRLAEQNLQLVLMRMCRDLEVFWEGGELGCYSYLINVPDSPIKLRFRRRT